MRKTFGNSLMTKTLTAIITASMLFSLTACGNGTSAEAVDAAQSTATAAAAEVSSEIEQKDENADAAADEKDQAAQTAQAQAEKEKNSVVGYYKLKEMHVAGEDGFEGTEEDIKMLESYGITLSAEFKEDGTVDLNMFGEVIKGTWKDGSITIEGQTSAFTQEGDILTINDGTDTIVLQKTTKEEIDKITEAAAPADETDGTIEVQTDTPDAQTEAPADQQAETSNNGGETKKSE